MAISEQYNGQVVYPSDEYRKDAYIDNIEEYRRLYKLSLEDPSQFWYNICKSFYWKVAPSLNSFLDFNFDMKKGPIYVKWMKGAVTNLCFNVLDRHIENGLADKVAYFWEGNEPQESRSITYTNLRNEVCKFANFLISKGLKKGDRIAIYMPVTIEQVVAMLGAVRIGVLHTVVFAGFSAQSLAERMIHSKCLIIVTADGAHRGTKVIPLKDIADSAIDICRNKGHFVKCCIVQRHLSPTVTKVSNLDINNNLQVKWNSQIDVWWDEAMINMSNYCEPVWVEAEDPLFILYTSGTTGKPKGIVHSVAGYMVYAATTFKYVFNYHSQDIFFCTADLSWITGHTVSVYGALSNAATIVLFDGTPFYPHPGRLWEIVDKLQVTIFYTAPTAILSLMKYGDEYVNKYSLGSLKLLGTAGEPINPQAWRWYYSVVGKRRCPIVDTYWQTETAAPMLTPLPGCTPLKPGSATFPFFGVVPVIMDNDGKEIEGAGSGILAFKKPWPSIARNIDGNHERYERTYFDKFKGYFDAGDSCYRDNDGYYWITGRCDDMLNVSGHLLSTAQVESAIVEHIAVAEAAAVSSPHPIKGECIYCFVVLKNGYSYSQEMEKEIKQKARDQIGAFAAPDVIRSISALPKTRCGKIMRRILVKVTHNDTNLGDISSMADESIIEELFSTRPQYTTF